MTDSLGQIELAARQYAEAREREMQLEHERPVRKIEAIKRVMQFENPLNGKPHSASSAESQVELDEEYAGYLSQQRQAVINVIMARARYEVALIEAKAEVAA